MVDVAISRLKLANVTALLALLLASCAPQPKEIPPVPGGDMSTGSGDGSVPSYTWQPPERPNFPPLYDRWIIPVEYATDRAIRTTVNGMPIFDGNRGVLRYGSALVSIPRSHESGEIERPNLWRLEFSLDPGKHFTTAVSEIVSPEEWSRRLQARSRGLPKRGLMLFVHGYNVTFEDALFRTAQIQHDTGFKGAAVLFSWPSAGKTELYPQDEVNVQWSTPHLIAVLRRVLATSGTREVYLIAHSMGNRVLTDVLVELARTDPAARRKIKEVILAAPDIDAEIFQRDIAPRLPRAAQRVTLYASSKDLALYASRRFHGYRRAGDTNRGVVMYPPIETIDASAANVDMLGHSYIGASRSVLSDLASIIETRRTPTQRGMLPIRGGRGTYWKFPVKAR